MNNYYGLSSRIYWNKFIAYLYVIYMFIVIFAICLAEIYAIFKLLLSTMDLYNLNNYEDSTLYIFFMLFPFITALSLCWIMYRFINNISIINNSAYARGVTRREKPELYNLLENLCISIGAPVPKLYIIDTAVMNAFACGLSIKHGAITVTQGLIENLTNEELETVFAHELTHLKNGDSFMMIIDVPPLIGPV